MDKTHIAGTHAVATMLAGTPATIAWTSGAGMIVALAIFLAVQTAILVFSLGGKQLT